jgi:hypothetical protein
LRCAGHGGDTPPPGDTPDPGPPGDTPDPGPPGGHPDPGGPGARRRGTCARYTETVGSPSNQNRHGTSAAALTPTRGPETIFPERAGVLATRSAVSSRGGRSRRGESASQTSAPSRDLSISRAWQSRAGPRARSRDTIQASSAPGLRLVRRVRARSSPSMTAPARSRIADTVSSPAQTRFTQKCMP